MLHLNFVPFGIKITTFLKTDLLHLKSNKSPLREVWLFSALKSLLCKISFSLAPSAFEEAITTCFFTKPVCNSFIRSQRESAIVLLRALGTVILSEVWLFLAARTLLLLNGGFKLFCVLSFKVWRRSVFLSCSFLRVEVYSALEERDGPLAIGYAGPG